MLRAEVRASFEARRPAATPARQNHSSAPYPPWGADDDFRFATSFAPRQFERNSIVLGLASVLRKSKTVALSVAPAGAGLTSLAGAGLQNARTIGLYIALPDEAQTAELLAKWLGEKRLALPVVLPAEPAENREPRMVFREYTGPECLRKGAFGIPEPHGTPEIAPREIDLMLVPGVAFDRSGRRLGRGGGFYDRYLSQPEAAHIYKVGLCPPHALVDEVPTEPHDVRMDEIIVGEPSREIREL